MSIPVPSAEDLQAALSLPQRPEFIATGGFKAVYRAAGPGGVPEAVKAVYIPKADSDEGSLRREQLVARAKREIEALRECTHPSIVRLGGVEPKVLEIAGEQYLIYSEEFLSGASLLAWLGRDEYPPLDKLTSVMIALANAIECLAARGYIHRDIKPENVMDTGCEGRPFVVLDMGIAYKLHGTQLTRGGGPPGTLRYMAPELLRPDYKDGMDFRCDLYSAGLTVYVLAAKAHPFAPKPEAEHATAYRILMSTPQPLSELRPDLPLEFCRIIERCIRKRPALRYSSIEALKSELMEV